MARTNAVSNQKGGVRKTTSSMNVVACLARMGNKVSLLDLDPQENLSKAWGVVENAIEKRSLLGRRYAAKN